MIRIFDILLSLTGLLVLSPVFLVIMIIIPLDSRGDIFFLQTRVGKNSKDFRLIKFRTMATGADKKGDLTVGTRDSRITRVGAFLRRYKLDEIPQLLNVLKGDMSLVGPRPEIRKYVEMYTTEQKKVLAVRPGITDWASIEYYNENEILGRSPDPEKTYIEELMPAKILLNMQFIEKPTIGNYFHILGKTIRSLVIGH
ncbi:MAG: sugar transferase [Bacteroidales bacterium]|nr:sugar transferase [Bacteroidales bacterium]